MSLRRRITLATTVAVALVALTVAAAGYLSARSHLLGSTRQNLHRLAMGYMAFHDNPVTPGQIGSGNPSGAQPGAGVGNSLGANGASTGTGFNHKHHFPRSVLGGATGYFETVTPSGVATARFGGKGKLPVDSEVVDVAKSGKGSFYRDTTANYRGRGIHVEVLTVADPQNHTAVQVALPLTSDDSVLQGLLITYALLVGGGILLAGVIGAFVARSALRPIDRFSDRTEQVTSVLDERHTGALVTPPRLDATGASELRRLAVSFNQTLDALERSIQAQRHLIADASHELRTPMAALRSNVQIFMEAERLPIEDRIELQEAIIAELDELTQLVADVLDLARGAAPSDHVEALELDSMIRESVARAQRRSPTLSFDIELEPTVILNGPDRVARAISNVIDNACKWSPEGATVEIVLHEDVLTVRDHGPGFNESDLTHVFDRFYRADEARRLPGSGLGLAIVRQAAEAYGGFARASNAPDGGALIEVSFGSRSAESLTHV